MRFYPILILILVSIVSCKESKEKIKPSFGTMTESVYASVQLEPANYYQVFANASGIIEEIYISEGDTIEEGQILAKISSTQSILNIENANIGVDLAQEKYLGKETLLSNILQEIKLNETQLSLDSINLVRQQKLWNQGIGAKAELEAKELKYQATLSTNTLLKKQYQQSKQELESNYKQSLNALKKAKVNLDDYFIKSNISGKVYGLNKNKGELILPQEALAAIGDKEEFLVKLSVDEVDIARVALGQKALISLDAYPKQVFELVITKIYPLKDAKTQTFTLEAKFVEAPSKLFAGLSGEANILIASHDNTLWIPKDYLIGTNKVMTADGEVEVELGLQNMDKVQIVSGIDSATYILKPEK